MKLAVFLPNWIGDAVMATAALRAIRADYPTATVVGVMRPVIAETLRDAGLIDHEVLYHPRGTNSEWKGGAFLRNLRAHECDTALLLTNSLRTAWLAWRSGARRRIGFGRDWRQWLLSESLVPQSRTTPNPVIDEYLRLASQLGCRTLSREMQLAVSPESQTSWLALQQRWSRLGVTAGFVALNTGGAFGPAKNWQVESFAQLARQIVDEFQRPVVVLCGPSEQEDARQIVRLAERPQVVSLAGAPLSIGLTKAAIRAADLLVTTDSGPRHFAAAFQVPVVSLFGPTHIAWSETYYSRAVNLQVPVDCGPCQQRVCPQQHHRCMRDLSVEQVLGAVRQQLANGAKTALPIISRAG